MNKKISFISVITCLFAAACLSPSPLSASTSIRAVEAVHPTQVTFDSPLLRITTMYGVDRETFVKGTQRQDMMATSSTLLESAGSSQAAMPLERMRPYGYDLARDTGRQFEKMQQRYLTGNAEGKGEVAPEFQRVAAGDLPQNLDGTQQDAFQSLNGPSRNKVRSNYQDHHYTCVPKVCSEDDKECKIPVCDDNDAQCHLQLQDDQICTMDSTPSDDCTDYCETDDAGLVAAGSYGSGGGAGGYSGFGGGGGGSGGGGGGGGNHHNVVVPEPSTYLILVTIMACAAIIGRFSTRLRGSGNPRHERSESK